MGGRYAAKRRCAFAPKVVRRNYLQDVSDIENVYAQEEQNVGND